MIMQKYAHYLLFLVLPGSIIFFIILQNLFGKVKVKNILKNQTLILNLFNHYFMLKKIILAFLLIFGVSQVFSQNGKIIPNISINQVIDTSFLDGFQPENALSEISFGGNSSGDSTVCYFEYYGYDFYNNGIVISTGGQMTTDSIFRDSSFVASSDAMIKEDTAVANLLKNEFGIVDSVFSIYDVAFLKIDFTTSDYFDTLNFNYIFASEHFEEYAHEDSAQMQDVMGIFIRGKDPVTKEDYTIDKSNFARILTKGENTYNSFPVTISNIYSSVDTNENPYYEEGPSSMVFDGRSKSMNVAIPVTPCGEDYSLIIAVADVSNDSLDSFVFLEGGSLFAQEKEADSLKAKLWSDTVICTDEFDETAFLKVVADGGWGYYDYEWDPESATSENVDTATVAPDETTNYKVKVTDVCELETESNEVQVKIQCPIRIPNVFTPNGDGYNDTFEVEKVDEYKNVVMVIYNRWGKKVYESNHYENEDQWWDGGNNADGVYFYVLKMPNGKVSKGSITKISK